MGPSETDEVSSAVASDTEPEPEPEEPTALLAIEAPPDPRKSKAYKIANELLTTERSYVQVLHLIDQVFHFKVDQENRAHVMFPQELVGQMFANIKSIYQFHHDHLLPKLEERMSTWENTPRIGDIMKSLAPFLKMYTEYVKNFDNAMSLINLWQKKNAKFNGIMQEIHQLPECGNLTLQHHMLSPVQRIPRYELLLKDYLKKLPDELSTDRADTQKALELVSTAANHSNDAMRKIDKFKQLCEIQESLGGAVDLVSPTRELVKEGRIIKISQRSSDHQERYLFLFTDIILLCSPRLITNRMISGPCYRLRARFDVENVFFLEGDNLETTNTFYLQDSTKKVELYTETATEKDQWMQALVKVMQDLVRRKASLRVGTTADMDLGKQPPTLIRMDGVSRCMECSSQFTMMKRKHHCRACGSVVCVKCSNQKIQLHFEDSTKASRVCRQCYKCLSEREKEEQNEKKEKQPNGSIKTDENGEALFNQGKGILDVPANSTCIQSGYLQLKIRGKSWVRRWFSLHPDFVLYSFRSDSEDRAMTATPVPGFKVESGSEVKGDSQVPDKDRDKLFKMHHSKKTYYFQASSKQEAARWVMTLKQAARAELPVS